MINLTKKRIFIIAVFMAVCIVGIFVYVNLANDDIEKLSKKWCKEFAGDMETCTYAGQILDEVKNLENEIKSKCDNEYLGQANHTQCQSLKDNVHFKIKNVCENDKINPKACYSLTNFVITEELTKLNQNILHFRQLACEHDDLDACYKVATILAYKNDLQGAKNLLDANCQKSHQQSCDKLKELK